MADSQRKTAQIFNLSDASQMTSFNCTPTIYQRTLTQVNRSRYARTEWDINKFQPNVKYTISAQFNNAGASSVNIRILDSDGSTLIAITDTTTNTSGILQVTFVARNAKQYIRFYSNTLNTGNTSTVVFSDIMLNEGETALPYEPYGWLHSLRKLTTATESVENPLYSDGTAITAYTISGNTVQNGTPTPSNPVDVQGVGVRTENLFDWSAVTTGYRIVWSNGALIEDASAIMSDFIRVSRGVYRTNASFLMLGYDSSKAYVGTYNSSTTEFKKEFGNKTTYFNIPAEVKFVRLLSYSSADTLSASTMLNVGSTAKPYEPYGYKIPISSGGVTTNIYLGSTQTNRQIKKLVLTGEENWSRAGDAVGQTPYFRIAYFTSAKPTNVVCTHYISPNGNISVSNQVEGTKVQTSSEVEIALIVRPPEFAVWSADDFKSFLAQQYAAGTPVTVWYVLAEPETAVVNEPLMKIGDYADTLSNATAIPTTEGANSITVDTTVQPSEFTATWTGWHDASVKEWGGSQWD